MAYHADFWITVAAAAPVVALSYAVLAIQIVRSAAPLVRVVARAAAMNLRTIEAIERRDVPAMVQMMIEAHQLRATWKQVRRSTRIRTWICSVVLLVGAAAALAAFTVAVLGLAWKRDLFPPIAFAIPLIGSAALLVGLTVYLAVRDDTGAAQVAEDFNASMRQLEQSIPTIATPSET